MYQSSPLIGQRAFDPKTTEVLVDMLNQSLVDTLDLAYWTNQAHATIKGQNLYSLHLLFDQLHGQLLAFGDEFAGRTVALGGQIQEPIQAKECPATRDGATGQSQTNKIQLDALVDRYGEYTGWMRRAMRQAGHLKDQDIAHLYTVVSQAGDKALWLLTANHEA